MDNKILIFTDGACSGNPGEGAWAALLSHPQKDLAISGYEEHTTNQRMEMKAVIEALKCLSKPSDVIVHTDSAYVERAFNAGWITGWIKNGWINSKKEPVKNKDLWEELIALTGIHQVEFKKVKGHSGHKENEFVDELAVSTKITKKGVKFTPNI